MFVFACVLMNQLFLFSVRRSGIFCPNSGTRVHSSFHYIGCHCRSHYFESLRPVSCKDIGSETLLQLITQRRMEEVASNFTSSAS